VQIPADTPLASVSTKPVPGWTATTTTGPIDPPVEVHGTKVSEAVTEITWTADPGAGIAPGQYQTFSISAGPIPDVDELVLPTIQTYDDGKESAWIEPAVGGQAEPENPAPVLTLTGADTADGGSGNGDTSSAADASTEEDSDGDGLAVTALVVGALGLVAGAAGLGLALAARRRTS
jgi:hypothetical protein